MDLRRMLFISEHRSYPYNKGNNNNYRNNTNSGPGLKNAFNYRATTQAQHK